MDTVLLRCRGCSSVNRVPAERLHENPICGRCKAVLTFPSAPVTGTHLNFREEALDWPGMVLVELWAAWCGACRVIAPVLDKIAREMAGRLKVVKIDVDQEPSLAADFGAHATPTLVLYINGRKKNRIEGALSLEQLKDWIKRSSET